MISLKRKRKITIAKEIKVFSFIFYIVLLLALTVLPILIPPIGEHHVEWNINPLHLVSMFESRWAMINTMGNVMLFAPVTILGLLNHYKLFEKWKSTLIFSLLFSISIEFVQLIESAFGFLAPSELAIVDINDVIRNTLGGMIGWLCIKFYDKYR